MQPLLSHRAARIGDGGVHGAPALQLNGVLHGNRHSVEGAGVGFAEHNAALVLFGRNAARVGGLHVSQQQRSAQEETE